MDSTSHYRTQTDAPDAVGVSPLRQHRERLTRLTAHEPALTTTAATTATTFLYILLTFVHCLLSSRLHP